MSKEVPPSKDFTFKGGPRDGTSLRLINPPWRYMRLAFPEWCTYEFDVEQQSYFYVGTEPVPSDYRGGW